MECGLMPVLLRASSRQKATNFIVPPRQNDERHQTLLLYRQPIHMPVYHLTKSEEIPINVAHYEVSSLSFRAAKILITSSPIFTVHYENSQCRSASNCYGKGSKRQEIQSAKQWFHLRRSEEFIPKLNVCERVLLKAPEKQLLKLCSTEESNKEPKIVTEIIIEEEFYDAIDTYSNNSVEDCNNVCIHGCKNACNHVCTCNK